MIRVRPLLRFARVSAPPGMTVTLSTQSPGPPVEGQMFVRVARLAMQSVVFGPSINLHPMAGQSLSPARMASSARMGAPIAAPGAVTIAASRIVAVSRITPPGIDNGAMIVRPQRLVARAPMGAAGVVPGPITLAAGQIVAAVDTAAPQMLAGGVTVASARMASVAGFGRPAVAPGAVTVGVAGVQAVVQARAPSVAVAPAATEVTRLASDSGNLESGPPLPTGSGAVVSQTKTYWNESGAPITHLGGAFFWNPHGVESTLPTLGTLLVGNYTLTATFQYLNGPAQNFTLASSNNIPSNSAAGHTLTDIIELATPIPAGVAVVVTVTATVASGVKYNPNMLGFAGLLTRRASDTIRVPVGFGGDSLFNTPGVRNFSEAMGMKRFPSINFAQGGSRSTYWGSGTKFSQQAAFMAAVGVKDFISEWSINDPLDGTTAAQTMTALTNIESQCLSAGLQRFWQTTQSGRGIDNPIPITTLIANADTLVATVADASAFRVNDIMTINGATGTGAATVNGQKLVEAISGNDVTLAFFNSAAISGAVAGTKSFVNEVVPNVPALMQPQTTREAIRGPLNASIRSQAWSGGFIEIGDRTETARDSGKKAVGGTQPELAAPVQFTAAASTSASQAVIAESDYVVRLDDTPTNNSYVAWKTGPARGLVAKVNNGFSDTQTVLFVNSLAATPAAGNVGVFFPRGNYANEPNEIHPDGIVPGPTENDAAGIWVNVLRAALTGPMGYSAYGLPDTPGTLFRDEFDRPEEYLTANANWTLVAGQARYVRVGRRALWGAWSNTGTGRAVVHSPDMGSADHWVEGVFRTQIGGTNAMLGLRVTSNANFIGLHASATTITVIKRVSGSNTTLATFTGLSLKRGDRIRFGILGSTITVWLNGVALAPSTGSLTALTALPASTTRQGVIVGARSEICWRYATGVMS